MAADGEELMHSWLMLGECFMSRVIPKTLGSFVQMVSTCQYFVHNQVHFNPYTGTTVPHSSMAVDLVSLLDAWVWFIKTHELGKQFAKHD